MEQWWGYLHKLGSIQVKRFYGMIDTDEAYASPFVEAVHGPFTARDREHAKQIVQEALSK